MEVDDSNDATTSDGLSEQDFKDKPIMKLFKNLIWSDSKENTVLTNAQIIELLQKDFQIDTSKLHELELEIYLHIVKRFLKEWPQWDEFDPIINKLRDVKDKTDLHKYLRVKYDQLKHYLTVMLDIARPRAKDKVKEAEDTISKLTELKTPVKEECSDVILEIHCSRRQLNTLFYRRPHPEKNNTVFNATTIEPNRIHIGEPSFSAILNWWNVGIILKYRTVHIIRMTAHESTHTLENKKLHVKHKVYELNQHFQEKCTNYSRNPGNTVSSDQSLTLPDIIKGIKCAFKDHNPNKCGKVFDSIQPIFDTLERDLKKFPAEDSFKDMVWYRKYFTKYPYKRYLYSKVDNHDDPSKKYDLRLKETISPMYQLHVIKLEPYLNYNRLKSDVQKFGVQGIQLECKSCSLKFTGVHCLEQLRQHICESHFDEPDWQCMKCKETFDMGYLSEHRWRHVCNSDNACL